MLYLGLSDAGSWGDRTDRNKIMPSVYYHTKAITNNHLISYGARKTNDVCKTMTLKVFDKGFSYSDGEKLIK